MGFLSTVDAAFVTVGFPTAAVQDAILATKKDYVRIVLSNHNTIPRTQKKRYWIKTIQSHEFVNKRSMGIIICTLEFVKREGEN